jgi:hypothetical protein
MEHFQPGLFWTILAAILVGAVIRFIGSLVMAFVAEM